MDWHLIVPALVCAVATYVCGHETLAVTERDGALPWIGAVLTVFSALATLIAVGAMLK